MHCSIRPAGILCCGNICFDIPVWPVDQFHWGTTTWVQEIRSGIGGNGGNTAYTIAKLGCPVRLVGVVGTDDHGEVLLCTLRGVGVDVSAVSRSDKSTNTTICIVNSEADRLFLHHVGCSADVTESMLWFDGLDTSFYSHLHLANPFNLPGIRANAAAILQRARGAGMTTSLDTGWDAAGRWMLDIGPCLPFLDLLFANESEMAKLTGRQDVIAAAGELRAAGLGAVVVKLGCAGAALISESGDLRQPAFPVDAVDSTGAGDCFTGGFLAALHHGRDEAQALRFACATGALNVTHLGGINGILDYEQTLAWMDQQERRSDAIH